MNIALILAGGRGTRFGTELPKQFVKINEKPLIIYTLEKFQKCENVDEVYVICLSSHIDDMKKIIKEYSISKVKDVIMGGNTRHESIRNGINYLLSKKYNLTDKVIIHNANMPLVSETNIINCIKKCDDESIIVTTAAKCHGYFYKINENDNSLDIGPDRQNVLHAKVPEVMFLKAADKIYNNEIFMDKIYESYTSGMLGIICDMKVICEICESTNMKVTTKEDSEFVKTYLRKN